LVYFLPFGTFSPFWYAFPRKSGNPVLGGSILFGANLAVTASEVGHQSLCGGLSKHLSQDRSRELQPSGNRCYDVQNVFAENSVEKLWRKTLAKNFGVTDVTIFEIFSPKNCRKFAENFVSQIMYC
jgi:hypothetical protein